MLLKRKIWQEDAKPVLKKRVNALNKIGKNIIGFKSFSEHPIIFGKEN